MDSGSGNQSMPSTGQVALPKRLIQLGIGIHAGIWSAVGFALPFDDLCVACDHWSNFEPSGIGEELNRQVLPCPPTINQARRDNRFTMENPILPSVFYPNTHACFRQIIR